MIRWPLRKCLIQWSLLWQGSARAKKRHLPFHENKPNFQNRYIKLKFSWLLETQHYHNLKKKKKKKKKKGTALAACTYMYAGFLSTRLIQNWPKNDIKLTRLTFPYDNEKRIIYVLTHCVLRACTQLIHKLIKDYP